MPPEIDPKTVNVLLSAEEQAAIDESEDGDTPAVVGGAEPEPADAAASTPASPAESSSTPSASPAPADTPATPAAAEPATPAAPVEDERIPRLRLPEIVPSRAIPADLDAQLAKMTADQAELDKKYFDDGEIEAKEYQKLTRALTEQRADLVTLRSEAAMVVQTNQATRTAHWQNAQEAFFDANPRFRDPVAHGALDAALRTLYADAKYAGADYSYLLGKAGDMVSKAFGAPAAAPAATPAAPAAPPRATAAVDKAKDAATRARADLAAVPRTLGGLPAADSNRADGDEYSHLDNLGGMELEAALAKMTPDQQRTYLGG